MFYISRKIQSVAFFHFSCYNDCTINSNLSGQIALSNRYNYELNERLIRLIYRGLYMKIKKLLIPLLLIISCMYAFSACTDDPYKNYRASGLEVKGIPFNYDDENTYTFGYNKAELITDYESFAAYNFNLDYTESYFELNNLIVFNVTACSSDEMEFGEILENDGKLYPLFYRKKIADGQPVTDDFIVMQYCVEISKELEYKVGEIIYRYK